MHVHVMHVAPGHLTAQETQRVLPRNGERSNGDHASSLGGHRDLQHGAVVRSEHRHCQFAQRVADRQLNHRGQLWARSAVLHLDREVHLAAGDDVGAADAERSAIGARSQQERQCDEQQKRGQDCHKPCLDPADRESYRYADDRDREHKP